MSASTPSPTPWARPSGWLLLTATTLWLAQAQAQPQAPNTPQPDALEQGRQQARERQLREQLERAPDVHVPPPEASPGTERLATSESPCVLVEKVVLTGDAAQQFQWAIKAGQQTADGSDDSPLGRCVGASGINLLMRRIQNTLFAQGYVAARVLLGPQEKVAPGTLELTLFPGRIRRVVLSPDSSPRATPWNALPARPGDLLNLRDIEQGLENFKRVPTAEVDIQITPAEGADAEPGQSDLVIAWQQKFPFRLHLGVDDSGARSTGRYQVSTTISYDHGWTLNDLFYVSVNRDLGGGLPGVRGTQGFTAHYSLPLAYWLLSFTTSSNTYHQSVAGAGQTYVYSGDSRNSEIKLSRLVFRDATRKTSLSLRAWLRASRNFIDDTEIEVQRRRTAGWDLGLSHRQFIGASTLDLTLNHRRGTGWFSALRAPEEPFGEGSSRLKVTNAEAQLDMPLSAVQQGMRYSLTWRAQINGTPLVPQDRFSIGGRHTVRGFDGESQLSAERGWLLRNDFSCALGQSGQAIYLGVDAGQVGGPSSQNLIGTSLRGAVIGLRGTVKGTSYDIFLGKPLKQPDGFKAANGVAGFSVNVAF